MTIELLEINKTEKTKVLETRSVHLEISDDTSIRLIEKYEGDKDFLTKAFSVGLIAMDNAGTNAENVTLSTHVNHLADKLNSFVYQNQNTLKEGLNDLFDKLQAKGGVFDPEQENSFFAKLYSDLGERIDKGVDKIIRKDLKEEIEAEIHKNTPVGGKKFEDHCIDKICQIAPSDLIIEPTGTSIGLYDKKGDGVIISPFDCNENSFYELTKDDILDLLKVWNKLDNNFSDYSKIGNKEKTKYQILNERIKNN